MMFQNKQHFKQEIIFYIYLLTYVYVYHKEVCSAHRGQKGALLDLQKVVNHLKWLLGIKPRSRQEHQVLLTTEPSVQSLIGVVRRDPLYHFIS